jgi:3alpha(or 20beta)-hydroxysteroid dehydrogenase
MKAQDLPMEDHWPDKAALVTGGARGQGAAVALQLLQAGAEVFVMDPLSPADAAWASLLDAAAGLRGRLHCLALDVSRAADWEQAAQALRGCGRGLYGLVNNAGITGPRNTVTHTVLQDWERVLAINLTGAMLGIRTLAPLMPPGASIVNVSSTVGMTGYYSAAYSASKWALRGLTRSAALELASAGIRVNCVCPGVVDTEMIRSSQALVAALQPIIPMQRMAAPRQIADVMFFLLGPRSSYVTGADIPVDGGVTGGGIYWPVGRALGALAGAQGLHAGKPGSATGQDGGPGAVGSSIVATTI